ncbi:uncharacterized protein LOC103315718 [Nasonia vitripennis]|uniref:Uncharacterized protein n=1 Tax=Nasonia vitripennis TaxID=7425 RepID=A0A7M7H7N8_NASVI|nr:uncharacterized protein LOC103315718 [Nasonia vitripennis]
MEDDGTSKITEDITGTPDDEVAQAAADEDTEFLKEPSAIGDKSVTISRAPSVAPKAAGTKSVTLSKPASASPSRLKKSRSKKKDPKAKKCAKPQKWECEEEALWRIYMRTFTEAASKRAEMERDSRGVFGCAKRRKQPADIPRLPDAETPMRFEFNAFNVQGRGFVDGSPKLTDSSAMSIREDSEFEWPKLWPCSKRDIVREQKILARKKRMKETGALPCEIDEVDSPESSDDERLQELAHQKELVHARIPYTYPKKRSILLIDRASGEHPGLVDGDYVTFELLTKKGVPRTYANVCLRGLTGMHLAELERTRETTWKFCLYQALVALLTKTQLRYKFTWSANIDYIYQHAWMLFLHIGYLNVKPNQRFDDVLVYNYRYSVELELVQELKNVPVVSDVSFKYVEKSLQKQRQRPRKELTLARSGFGVEKQKDEFKLPVHKGTKMIEKWFDELEMQFTNCVIRTTRFALAFWQDGPFWYLYNPYRCDKFGFWNDAGFASITKFCTRDSLKRHLMILMLRAYAYEASGDKSEDKEKKSTASNKISEESKGFTIQIFQLIFHTCQIHNVKLYQRSPRKPKLKLVKKQESDLCTFDPLAKLSPMPCGIAPNDDKSNDKMEKPSWLQDYKITWSKSSSSKTNIPECGKPDITKWHHFDVIESRRLYVLWGQIHITDRIFAEENRSRQTEACYAVCAGMSLINAPEYWSAEILNAVVVCGDKFYTDRRLKFPDPNDWSSHPTDHFLIGTTRFDLSTDPPITGRLFVRSDQCLWRSLTRLFQNHRFAVLTCENSCLGLFKHCGAYYACDVGSYGPPVFERGHGSAYLLRVSCFEDYVRCLVLLIGSNECSGFELRPLEIGRVVHVQGDECSGRKKTKCPEDVGVSRKDCPFENERSKGRKRGRRPSAEEKKKYDRTVCSKRDY